MRTWSPRSSTGFPSTGLDDFSPLTSPLRPRRSSSAPPLQWSNADEGAHVGFCLIEGGPRHPPRHQRNAPKARNSQFRISCVHARARTIASSGTPCNATCSRRAASVAAGAHSRRKPQVDGQDELPGAPGKAAVRFNGHRGHSFASGSGARPDDRNSHSVLGAARGRADRRARAAP